MYRQAQNTDKQRSEIEGVMKGLKEQMMTKAPRSETASKKDPAFASPTRAGGGNNDGMLGSLLLEGLLGMAFGEAVTGALTDASPAASNLNVTNTVQAWSEFASDRYGANRANDNNTDYRLGKRGMLSGSFQDAGSPFPQEEIRKEFFPGERAKIEGKLARYGMMIQRMESVPYAPAMY